MSLAGSYRGCARAIDPAFWFVGLHPRSRDACQLQHRPAHAKLQKACSEPLHARLSVRMAAATHREPACSPSYDAWRPWRRRGRKRRGGEWRANGTLERTGSISPSSRPATGTSGLSRLPKRQLGMLAAGSLGNGESLDLVPQDTASLATAFALRTRTVGRQLHRNTCQNMSWETC